LSRVKIRANLACNTNLFTFTLLKIQLVRLLTQSRPRVGLEIVFCGIFFVSVFIVGYFDLVASAVAAFGARVIQTHARHTRQAFLINLVFGILVIVHVHVFGYYER